VAARYGKDHHERTRKLILEVAKRVAPSDSVPGDVLEVIRKALLEHFREPARRIVLKPRGKSGKGSR
jgi:hypothetical protein